MIPIQLNLPAGSEESNYLYPELEPDDLTQDMLTVGLPNGYYIDVGWFPEHDVNGRFLIRVFYEHWNRQVLGKPIVAQCVTSRLYRRISC